MRIDDASHLARQNEPSNTTLVLPPIAEGELSVLEVEPEDTSLEAVLAVLSQHGRPVIITLPQQSGVFSSERDFARAKDAGADIISFVLPRERMADMGRFASATGFHFTSQLEKAEATFLQRQRRSSGPGERSTADDPPRPR